MRKWCVGLVVCWLAAGCGEQPLEEVSPVDMPTAEAGEVSALACEPVLGEAQRVKVILPPSTMFSRFAEMPESFVEFRGQLFFAVNFEDGHRAVWKSDGTEAGTAQVQVFPPLPFFSFDRLHSLTPAGDRLFFVASEAATGSELYVTDGTPGAAQRVADLTPGAEGSFLSHLMGVGSSLVFFRELSAAPGGYELWRSDGTTVGTERLLTLPGDTSVSWQDMRLGNTLLFFVSAPTRGVELWKTDGTAAGTGRIRRLDAGEAFVFDVRTSGGTGFFTLLDEGSLTEVWMTDGTSGGTQRLRTFGPGAFPRLLSTIGTNLYVTLTDQVTQRMHLYRMPLNGHGSREYVASLPNPYANQLDAFPSLNDVSAVDGRIFFSIAIGSSGPAPRDTQLWATDGTRHGTRLLRRPLSLSDEYSSPVYAVSSRLAFFSAFEAGAGGIEPWLTEGSVAGTRRLRDVAPGGESSYPRTFLRVGSRVFFNAYDDTLAGQLWSVPLLRTCVPGAAKGEGDYAAAVVGNDNSRPLPRTRICGRDSQ
jgi:ELWxxDGT repeat protein